MESFHLRSPLHERDMKNVPSGCDELTIILSANSARDVGSRMPRYQGDQDPLRTQPCPLRMGCAYFAATETDANLPHVAETFDRMFYCIVVRRSSKPTVLYDSDVVLPSSPMTGAGLLLCAPHRHWRCSPVRSSPPTVGRASAP